MTSGILSLGELNLILQQPGSYDLSTLTFSNYESIHTRKALVGIFPVKMRLKFREIYPVSLSDSNITQKIYVLSWIEEEHEIISEKEFSIQEILVSKVFNETGHLKK